MCANHSHSAPCSRRLYRSTIAFYVHISPKRGRPQAHFATAFLPLDLAEDIPDLRESKYDGGRPERPPPFVYEKLSSEDNRGRLNIRRPMLRGAPEREPTGPRVNEAIRAREVRLIDENGQNLGIVSRSEALERAEAAGLDLVEVSPDSIPPVCKILDYGKFKYQEQKKAAEARKHQKTV